MGWNSFHILLCDQCLLISSVRFSFPSKYWNLNTLAEIDFVTLWRLVYCISYAVWYGSSLSFKMGNLLSPNMYLDPLILTFKYLSIVLGSIVIIVFFAKPRYKPGYIWGVLYTHYPSPWGYQYRIHPDIYGVLHIHCTPRVYQYRIQYTKYVGINTRAERWHWLNHTSLCPNS